MNVKTLLGSLLVAATAISPALAQTYSVKPISLIVPYPAGGPSDFFARKVQPEATAKLGKTVDELLALARKNAGKPLSYGSVGPSSLYHLIGEKFSQLTQVEMLHVP
jgi:tripartite-type tricarboxylate transporter receptor subunit TctC